MFCRGLNVVSGAPLPDCLSIRNLEHGCLGGVGEIENVSHAFQPVTHGIDAKPYTVEVRRGIDWELAERRADYIQRQKPAGKPFFLYLPITHTHFPNCPQSASRAPHAPDNSAIS